MGDRFKFTRAVPKAVITPVRVKKTLKIEAIPIIIKIVEQTMTES
jgi:hypothetical protein